MNIAIIGAGPVGCYVAAKLSDMGHEVVIYEKKNSIGFKPCSGLYSERLWGFVPRNDEIIENSFDKMILHFPFKDIELRLKQRLFAIDRKGFNKYIEDIALSAGAEVILNKDVKINEDMPSANRIIGCDGALSVIRKHLQIPDPPMRLGIIGFERRTDNSDFINVWPNDSGFLWKIPRGDRIEWGVLAPMNKARQMFEALKKAHAPNITNTYAALIPCGLVLPQSENITLCGDASGLTKPWSGGGIIWSFIAADMLIKTFPDFSRYRKEVFKCFLLRQRIGKLLSSMVPKLATILPKQMSIDTDWIF